MHCFTSARAAFKLFIRLNHSTPWEVFALGFQIYKFYWCEKTDDDYTEYAETSEGLVTWVD